MHSSRASRVAVVSIAVVVAALVGAVWAVAQEGDASTTVTGCLNANGNLEDFTLSGAPAKACKAGATQVQLGAPRAVTNHTVFRRVPFVVNAVNPAPPQTIMTLHLPAGKYVVSTHVLVFGGGSGGGESSFSHLRCSTSPSIGAPSSGLVLTDLNVGNTNGATGAGTLAGTSPMFVADESTIQTSCRTLSGFGPPPTVAWGVITATAVDDIVLEEDTTTG